MTNNKKKESKMSEIDKKSLDLDFDDISGSSKTTPTEEVQEAVATNKPEKTTTDKQKRDKKYDYNLAIPQMNGTFVSKSLQDCTGEEFLVWAASVHPHVTRPAEDFDSRDNRLKAFKQIVGFHKNGLIWLRSQQLPKEELLH